MLAVGLGAGLGALARFLLGSGIWITLGINILGSFAITYFRPHPFWGAGFLSGFTTMSGFAVLALGLPIGYAIGYIMATVFGCLTAAWLGARRWS